MDLTIELNLLKDYSSYDWLHLDQIIERILVKTHSWIERSASHTEIEKKFRCQRLGGSSGES